MNYHRRVGRLVLALATAIVVIAAIGTTPSEAQPGKSTTTTVTSTTTMPPPTTTTVPSTTTTVTTVSSTTTTVPSTSTTVPATTTTVPSTTTTTLPGGVTEPTGPPAPADFAPDVVEAYSQATAAEAPPTTASSEPTTTPAEFSQLVGGLSADQLNQLYDADPSGWGGIFSSLDNYNAAVSSAIASGAAHAAANPIGPGVAHLRGAQDLTPSPPVVFSPDSCPGPALGSEAGYPLLYSLDVAQQAGAAAAGIVESLGTLADNIVDTVALSGVEVSLAVEIPIALAAQAAGFVAEVLASALDIPPHVVEFLIDREENCLLTNTGDEISFVDGNVVSTENNLNTIYGLDEENFQQDEAISSLLDSRAEGIINQLNVAQASLNQDLYHDIEDALVGGRTASIVSYELPSSLGGYLDATPIGVQAIVTSTLAMMQTANQPFAPAATKNLVLANNALNAGQYKAAFALYQTTYQLLVH